MTTTVLLPRPPALNNLFVNVRGKGRVKSPSYKAWEIEAGYTFNRQQVEPVDGPVRLSILVEDRGRGDIDGLIKAPLDYLVHRGVIEEDNREIVRGLSIDWSDDVRGMQITISPARRAPFSPAELAE